MSAAANRALIVGLGRSGLSCLQFLRARGVAVDVTDAATELAALDGLDGIERRLGGLAWPRRPEDYAMLVLSPGIAPSVDLVREAREAGIDIVNDIELFAREVDAPVVGVTGSNGKSTVVSMLHHVLCAQGIDAGLGGNIGTPALELLGRGHGLHVLELSSFQLEVQRSLHCLAATVLNVSDDHLDRHADFAEYAAIKRRIFDRCDRAVVNIDDAAASRCVSAWSTVGLGVEAGSDWSLVEDESGGCIRRGDAVVVRLRDLRVAGLHNLHNAMSTLALVEAAGADVERAAADLGSFTGLPHRCQWVGEYDGVQWYDDSKGTNVGSTVAALQGLPAPIIWLGGGVGKGQDFHPLAPVLAARGKAAITFGRDGDRIADALASRLPIYREPDLRGSVARARSLAEPGDTVLLSPACASFDQFDGYVSRGRAFVQAVREQHA